MSTEIRRIDDATDARSDGAPSTGGLLVSPEARFVFVGERRSATAIARGLRWEDGRLAARTLHDALRALGVDPGAHRFLNLFRDDTPGVIDPTALAQLRALAREGWVIVGLGRIVQAALVREGVKHRPMVHPAARGVIRTRAYYQAHVARILSQDLAEDTRG